MLTLEQCRKLAPELADLSDDKLLEIRDTLYQLAQLALDSWFETQGSKSRTWSLPDSINQL